MQKNPGLYERYVAWLREVHRRSASIGEFEVMALVGQTIQARWVEVLHDDWGKERKVGFTKQGKVTGFRTQLDYMSGLITLKAEMTLDNGHVVPVVPDLEIIIVNPLTSGGFTLWGK